MNLCRQVEGTGVRGMLQDWNEFWRARPMSMRALLDAKNAREVGTLEEGASGSVTSLEQPAFD